MWAQVPNHQIPKPPSTQHIPTHSTYGTEDLIVWFSYSPSSQSIQVPGQLLSHILDHSSNCLSLSLSISTHTSNTTNYWWTTCPTAPLYPFPLPPPDGDDPTEGLPISLISSRNTSQSKFGQGRYQDTYFSRVWEVCSSATLEPWSWEQSSRLSLCQRQGTSRSPSLSRSSRKVASRKTKFESWYHPKLIRCGDLLVVRQIKVTSHRQCALHSGWGHLCRD